MKIKCIFAGGLQVLFEDKHELEIELKEKSTIRDLILVLQKEIKRTPELFVIEGNKLRAGILVLINDADWELYEEYGYVVQQKDVITFISTLHGGQLIKLQ